MRARIVGRRSRAQRSWIQWHASLTDPATGRVVWADDCRDLARIADDAREVAHAFTRCAELGQTFRPWSDICDEADI